MSIDDTKIGQDLLSAFAQSVKEKYVKGEKGDRGAIGLEGRTPIHIQKTQPYDSISQIGDLWFQP